MGAVGNSASQRHKAHETIRFNYETTRFNLNFNFKFNMGKPELTEELCDSLVKSTRLPADQVKELFESFLEDHPDGKVTKEVFREMMKETHKDKDISKMEGHMFRIYDTNNDGSIEFNEFLISIFALSSGTPTEILTRMFGIFDTNRDGTITKEEFTKLIKDMSSLLITENPEQTSEDLFAKSAFAEMDKDEDGKITTEEFVTACLAEEKFSKQLALKLVDLFNDDAEDALYDSDN